MQDTPMPKPHKRNGPHIPVSEARGFTGRLITVRLLQCSREANLLWYNNGDTSFSSTPIIQE